MARRVASETARFLIERLSADGMFVSSLDADTNGVEGSTYVWTPAALKEVLGEEDGEWAAKTFGVTREGTFEKGQSVLQLSVHTLNDVRPQARALALAMENSDTDEGKRLGLVKEKLLAARDRRLQPGKDDKVVTVWNGLAITALAEASVALADPALALAAAKCARKLIDIHLVDGRLRRASLRGKVGESAGVLEDYAALATGLFALYQLGLDQVQSLGVDYLDMATALLDTALEHFRDEARPGFWFDTAKDSEALIMRPASPTDGATPGGASLIAEALLTAAHLLPASDDRARVYDEAARTTLAAHKFLLQRAPQAAPHWLAVAEAAVRGPLQIAVASEGPAESELLKAARLFAPGGSIVVGGRPNSSALLKERNLLKGAEAAYVCRGKTCELPVSTPTELAKLLQL